MSSYLESVRAEFDLLQDYDEGRDRYYFERRLQKILRVLPEDKRIRILDFGGGSGLFTQELRSRGYTNTYLIDLSPVQVRQAKEKGLPMVYCGNETDARQKFRERFFDVIIMCDVIEHVENPAQTLLTLAPLLKHGGKLVLTYPNPHWVPVLNVLGHVGLKLKGHDNRIFLRRLYARVREAFVLAEYEGHMLVSKLPPAVLSFFERIERCVPTGVRQQVCLLNTAVLLRV